MKNYLRKHKKIILIIVSILSFTLLTTYGRYIYNAIHDFILESQGFYFSSSVLTSYGSGYKINNWDGVNSYSITIDVNNKKNDLIYTKGDIEYSIDYNCSDNVTCSISKTSGTIYSKSYSDSYIITMTPKKTISDDELVTITTSATSTSPYVKKLSATYKIGIEKKGFSYKIIDNSGDKYLTLDLTNSITYYIVSESFDSYSVGDKIPVSVYKNLSSDNKLKCFSAIVKLSFDPNVLSLDMTDTNYLNRNQNSLSTQDISGYNYVKGFNFNMLANSNQKIIFYKNDPSKDYTYPITNDTSIISVDVNTAN